MLIPKKKEDERKFGDVRGLTGGMVSSLIRGYQRLGRLAPVDRIEDVTALWKHWGQIIDYVEHNSTVSEAFYFLLTNFGQELIDIFDDNIDSLFPHYRLPHHPPDTEMG